MKTSDVMMKIAEEISAGVRAVQAENGGRALIAIDGRCASGKTTLAAQLQRMCAGNVIHMDHFFPRPEQRSESRRNQPGGNIDYERFLEEVIPPIGRAEAFSYRPFDCTTQQFAQPIAVEPNPITIIEGSYSCHPALIDRYDLKVFLTIDADEQLRRIEARDGPEQLIRFREMWIPLEERYFAACRVEENCDLVFRLPH